MLRVSAEVRARAINAAELAGVSLNDLAVDALRQAAVAR